MCKYSYKRKFFSFFKDILPTPDGCRVGQENKGNRKKQENESPELPRGSSGPGRGSVRRRSWRKQAPHEKRTKRKPCHPRGWLGLRTRKRPEKELAEVSPPRKENQEEGSPGPPKGVARAPDAEASGRGASGSQLTTKKKPGARKVPSWPSLDNSGPPERGSTRKGGRLT